MSGKGLENLFFDTLRDIYYAERHILKNLPELHENAVLDELKAAFQTHIGETEGQIQRLEKVFELIDRPPTSKRCEAIDGILAEGEDILEDYKDTAALDAGLISAAQAVEHYEITRYGTLRRWARMLSIGNAYDLLTESLEEERHTDELLTRIADKEANAKAAQVPKE